MELIKIIFERRNKMEEKIQDLLEEEIKSEIRSLTSLSPGSKEKSTAIEDLSKLYRLKIEDTKAELDSYEKQDQIDSRILEQRLKREQLSEQVKDRYFKLGIAAAEIILPMIFYAIWMKRGFKFEETGTYTSTTFKGLFNRFKPTKK